MIKRKHNNDAVSEVVGVILLLGMAVTVFSLVYFSLMSAPAPVPSPDLNILGFIEDGNITIQHCGGEALDSETILQISLAGIRTDVSIEDYLVDLNQDGLWQMGEKVIYPPNHDLNNIEVGIGIADRYSNSLVLLGNLQEGYLVPPFGRGGIWHFDENSGSIAYDSSGNNNHGTIVNATWTTGVNNSALSFDGIDDYVTVQDSPGLDISSDMTIEAWMKPSSYGDHIIDQLTFDFGFGFEPDFVRLESHIFAVAYRGQQFDGFLKTFEIDPDGTIADGEIDVLEYDEDQGENPDIFHVSGNTYAIAYCGPDNDGYIKTFSITSDGQITDTPLDTMEFEGTDCYNPDIINIAGNYYAIVYEGPGSEGFVKTVQIYPNGEIADTVVDSLEFDTSNCYEPDLVHVAGNYYAIAYHGSSDHGVARSITISPTGDIGSSYIDELIFEDDYAAYPVIIRRTATVYAVVYEGHNGDSGILTSFSIDTNGYISNTIIDSYEFESFKCYTPDIVHFLDDDDLYAIAYRGGPSHTGYITLININADGTIDRPPAYHFEFESVISYTPKILKLSKNVLIVIYQKQNQDGIVETLRIPGSAHPRYAGIFKSDEYALYADETTVYGSINDITLTASRPPGWTHIALIYNSSTISLYINGSLVTYYSPYSEVLNRGDGDLEFGTSFYGNIDEIAIFDHAITEEELLIHSNPDTAGNYI